MNGWLAARNILAVRLDNIGDMILLGPALRAIKETSPEARITVLASPAGTAAVPLLPWIDDVITWRASWQVVSGSADVGDFTPERDFELLSLLGERGFDAAIIFTSFNQSPHVPGYVCYLAGIPLRAGESPEFGGLALTTELRGVTPISAHQSDRNLNLVEALGFAARDRRLSVSVPAEARAAVPALLERAGLLAQARYVLLHPGASAKARRYPADRFGEVARLLTETGQPVLVTGIEREMAILHAVLERAPGAAALIGGYSLAEYAALLERACLVVCNDTLPMHLADAVGTPEVVTFSGTDLEEQWQPRDVPATLLRRPTPCSPCYYFACPIGLPCLDISPEEVAHAVHELLPRTAERELAAAGTPTGGSG